MNYYYLIMLFLLLLVARLLVCSNHTVHNQILTIYCSATSKHAHTCSYEVNVTLHLYVQQYGRVYPLKIGKGSGVRV